MKTYTDAQATDEAVLLLTRKLRRLYPDTYTALMNKLPEGAREALDLADIRADKLRATVGNMRYDLVADKVAREIDDMDMTDDD